MEINLKGRIVDAEHITGWRLHERYLDIIVDSNSSASSIESTGASYASVVRMVPEYKGPSTAASSGGTAEFTVTCKSTREAKELHEYVVDKVNESHGCIIAPDPLHNNKFRDLVARIRKLSSHFYYLEHVPTNAWVYEASNHTRRSIHQFEFNRKLKLLEWEFVTTTGYWYSPWLVDAVEKLENCYKRKAELEDEREITMYEYEDRTGHPIAKGSPEDSHILRLDIEIDCINLTIKRQEAEVEDYKKGLKATPDELRIQYPYHHINKDGSLMDCPPPSEPTESKEFAFFIQKHGYHSMY